MKNFGKRACIFVIKQMRFKKLHSRLPISVKSENNCETVKTILKNDPSLVKIFTEFETVITKNN